MAPTVPGEGPGVYGCDYRTLAQIYVLHAHARMALLTGQIKVAPLATRCGISAVPHRRRCRGQ